MDHQTQMMNGTETKSDRPKRATPARNMTLDLLQLGELHMELLKADVTAATRALRVALVLAAIALGLFIAAAPVLLLTLASWMEESFGFSNTASLAIADFVAIALCVVFGTVAWRVSKQGASKLNRSYEELCENVTWLKQSLQTDEAHDDSRDEHVSKPR